MRNSLLTAVGLIVTLGAPAASAQSACSEGCSPNYWTNHKEAWDNLNADDYTQTVRWFMPFNAVFGVTPAQSGVGNHVDLITVADTSGSGLTALNRQIVAGLANADSLCFPLTVGQVIDLYRDAVGAIAGPESVSSATTAIVALNGQGCPLSMTPPPPPPKVFCVADQGDCPCGPGSLISGCVNSSGLGARLDSLGSTSVSADDLALVATQLPVNSLVLFLMADTPRRAPYLGGLYCVGGPTSKVFRIPPALSAGPNGTAIRSGGLVALSNTVQLPVPGGIRAGDTWYFQTFYRDMAGCSGTASMSNVLGLTFVP